MKRYLALLLLLIPMAQSSAQPPHIDVNALPQQSYIGGNVAYVASIQSTVELSTTATLTITARLDDISLVTIPESDCVTRNEPTQVIVWCPVSGTSTAITVRGMVLSGTRDIVTFTGEIDGAVDQDMQFVSGVDTLYLPMISK